MVFFDRHFAPVMSFPKSSLFIKDLPFRMVVSDLLEILTSDYSSLSHLFFSTLLNVSYLLLFFLSFPYTFRQWRLTSRLLYRFFFPFYLYSSLRCLERTFHLSFVLNPDVPLHGRQIKPTPLKPIKPRYMSPL